MSSRRLDILLHLNILCQILLIFAYQWRDARLSWPSSPFNLWLNIELIAIDFFSPPCISVLIPLKHLKSLGR